MDIRMDIYVNGERDADTHTNIRALLDHLLGYPHGYPYRIIRAMDRSTRVPPRKHQLYSPPYLALSSSLQYLHLPAIFCAGNPGADLAAPNFEFCHLIAALLFYVIPFSSDT